MARNSKLTHDLNGGTAPGPVPPDNEPGHHPDVEQDKPIGRRPRPHWARAAAATAAARKVRLQPREDGGPAERRHFPFAFAGPAGILARAFVLREQAAYVDVTEGVLNARFGLWSVTTPLSNITEVSRTGPYAVWKVAGPPHLSRVDRGLTFGTNTDEGVCIRFAEPVKGIEPTGRLRHPGLTVTVADVDGLMAALATA